MSSAFLSPGALALASARPRRASPRGASTSAPCASSPRGLPPLRVFAMAGQKDGRGGPRNRTGRTHDPYSTPLRDANRDRLYGMLTARAAMTLLTYLTEINKAGATFFQEYMANNPIPYAFWASGKVKDVSGETFIEGLLAMSPTNIEEKYRDNYITVDPPALAVRLLDIRLALRDEWIADLAHVREENADIMKVSCMTSLENSFCLDCDDVDFDDDGGAGLGPQE